jgi:hypothetical protein
MAILASAEAWRIETEGRQSRHHNLNCGMLIFAFFTPLLLLDSPSATVAG